MITKAEILSLDWEQIESINAYILYGTSYPDVEDDFSTLVLESDEKWLLIQKGINTYFGEIKTIGDLQTIMTNFDIP
mgnify:CR=1 FL=1